MRLDQRDIRSTASKLPERKRTRACFDDAWRVIWLKAGSDVMGLIIAGGCDNESKDRRVVASFHLVLKDNPHA